MRSTLIARRPTPACLVLLTAALGLSAGRGVPARTPTPAQAQTPTFRAGVTLATVDFLAVTADGKPVTDLKPQEVTVRVNGRTKVTRSLQLVQVGDAPASEGASEALQPVPPPFGSNAITEEGRSIVLVLDDETLRPGKEQPLKDAISRFLNTLSSRDRLSFVTVPHGGVKTDFTNDHERVRQIVSQVTGNAPREETGSEAACRSRLTLQALTGLFESLRVGESPTTVVFFSTSLLAPRRDAPLTMAPGMCELTTEVFQQTGAAAAAARAHVYMIQPDDIIRAGGANVAASSLIGAENIAGAGFTGSDNPRAGLEHLGGVTGAPLLHLTSTTDGAMTRVSRETSAYYLAAFEPEPNERTGVAQGLDVRVSRSGVIVRSRPQVVIPKAASRATGSSAEPITPGAMLREARTFRDLPLRTVAYASRVTGDDTQVKILAIIEPVDPAVTLTSVTAALFDTGGRQRATYTADAAEFGKAPVFAGLMAPPGVYRLRAAATDAAGRGGSADYEVVAELTQAGPLRLSGLVLGLWREGELRPKLQFGGEPVAYAYLEIYGRPPGQGAPVAIVFELAKSVNGPSLAALPAALEGSSEPDRFRATAAIPIGGLPTGDFVVRAFVQVEGQPFGRVLRAFRKAL
jgi:VWFA-related protein